MAERNWCYLLVHPDTKVKIDREDLERVSGHRWRVTEGTTGRIRIVTSIREGARVRNITLGKFLMDPSAGKQVYPRRFNDGLDYRKENLIVCSLAERQRLLPKNRTKRSSEYRGVSFQRRAGTWRAGIEVAGRTINLGDYATERKAAEAYNIAARKHFGPNAYQNPVDRKKKRRRR